MTATYSGDSFFGSSSGTTPLTVEKAGTSTTVTASGPYTYGESLTYQVTVTASSTGTYAESPSGAVDLTVGGTTLCSTNPVTLTAVANKNSTVGSCTSSIAPVGSDTVTATYVGDGNFATSSGTTSMTIDQAETTTMVSVGGTSPDSYGEPVTYTVTVTASPQVATPASPSGYVNITADGTELCSATLASGANSDTTTASCQSIYAPVASQTVTASYGGDTNYVFSAGTAPIRVEQATTTTQVSISQSSVPYGTDDTYSVVVQPNAPWQQSALGAASDFPTGGVDVYVGPNLVCVAPLDPSENAGTCNATAPLGSNEAVSAYYPGDANFSASATTTGPFLTVTVAPQSISFAAPSSATIGAEAMLSASGGGSGNPVVFTVDPASGPDVCSIYGSVVHFSAVGICVINANQAGNADYLAAPQVQQEISVTALGSESSPTSAPAPVILPDAAPPSDLPSSDFGAPISWTIERGAAPSVVEPIGGAKVTVTVPTGALPDGTTVSLYPVRRTSRIATSLPAGKSYLVAFALSWEESNGSVPAASKPISITIVDPRIVTGDAIYEVTSTGDRLVGNANVAGKLTLTFRYDPALLVTSNPQITVANSQLTVSDGTLPLSLACSASGCSGTVTLDQQVVAKSKTGSQTTTSEVLLASGPYKFGKSKKLTLHLTLSALGKRLFAQVPSQAVSALLKVTVNGGPTLTRTVRVS